jgi:hypothetical protein
MGDGDNYYRQEPFYFEEGGKPHTPPKAMKDRLPIRLLSCELRDALGILLANLTTKRYSIESAMGFCIKHQ